MSRKYSSVIYFISPLIFFSWTAKAKNLKVDISDRSQVMKFYFDHYLPSEGFVNRHEWTGSVENKDPGQLSERMHQDVIMRVNYFRAMAGLNANIKLSDDLNIMAQEAALMMSYENKLSHYPDKSWKYYSDAGVTAARNSNLSLGLNFPNYGPTAVDEQIKDAGDNNTNLGHRRWILYSKAPLLMGHGSIPLSNIIKYPEPEPEPGPEIDPNNRNSSMALWVVGNPPDSNLNPVDFIAWPPAGYVPRQVVYNRWSFAIPQSRNNSADFSSANVIVKKNDTEIPINIIYRGNHLDGNDPAIGFEMNAEELIVEDSRDQIFSVIISNIKGTEKDRYTYKVTTIEPNHLNTIPLTGPDLIYDDTIDEIEFGEISAAEIYELLISESVKKDWFEGVEDIDNLKVQTDSSTSNSIIVENVEGNNTQSFHLVNNGDNFQIINKLVPSEKSILKFDHFFKYVGEGTCLNVEILPDSGQWEKTWQRYGKHGFQVIVGDWDNAWNTIEIPLKQYSGQTIRVRLIYRYESGANWTPLPGEDPFQMGAFIDNISINECEEIMPLVSKIIQRRKNIFDISDLNHGIYSLRVKAKISNRWFDHSSSKFIQKINGLEPEIIVDKFKVYPTNNIEIHVISKGLDTLTIQSSENGGASWKDLNSKNIQNDVQKRLQFRFDTDMQNSTIYRVVGSKN